MADYINTYGSGYFGGRVLRSTNGTIGGTRHVFVKLVQGSKDQLVFPTTGMKVLNVPNGQFKMFEADFCQYNIDGTGYIYRTFEVAATTSAATTVTIVKDGFRHIPFVGDTLMAATSSWTTAGTGVTVTAVTSGDDTWTLTLSAALTLTAGTILVEADTTGSTAVMLVKPNMVLPWDMDFMYDPSVGDDEYEKAKYYFTPAFSAYAYESKMSPMPACVLALNESPIEGWFKLKS